MIFDTSHASTCCTPISRTNSNAVASCLKAVNVLYQRHKRVFPYGYPAAYVPNLHHQHIVVMRKD